MAGERDASTAGVGAAAGTALLTSGVSFFLSDSVGIGVLTAIDFEVRELCDRLQAN
jgi:hypothetical protein